MALPQAKRYITPEEYLRIERAAEFKSEYYDGEMFAMAGTTRWHARITTTVTSALLSLLRGGSCFPYGSDLRVNIPSTKLYTYPDITVICDPFESLDETEDTVTNPRVIVEVLSDSTEAYDRGKKFAHYRTLISLQEYVLISQKSALVEVFARQGDRTWKLTPVSGLDGTARLESLGIEVPLSEIYEGVVFPEAAPLKVAAR